MNDALARIEHEAKERQDQRVRGYRGQLDVDGVTMLYNQLKQAEAAVDELIAMVKRFPLIEDVMKHYPTLRRMEEQAREWKRDRDQARADVLKLRDALFAATFHAEGVPYAFTSGDSCYGILDDTEHYEQYR